jgi:hypothetical protein
MHGSERVTEAGFKTDLSAMTPYEAMWTFVVTASRAEKKNAICVKKNKHTCVPAAHGSTGRWLIRSLTYFAQPIGWKLRRCLRISHDRFGSSSDLCINGHLHYPNDVDRSLNEDPTNKIRKYRSDYNNNPPNFISFIPVIIKLLVRLGGYIVNLYDFYFYKLIGKLTAFLHLQELNLHYQTVDFSTTSEGRSRTTWNQSQPSHSQTSCLLTSSLSLGVPVPHVT